MKKQSNYILSSLLWVSHFLTDALAAFVLTTITIAVRNSTSSPVWYFSLDAVSYFFLYNFFAFFLQIFLGYFYDSLKGNALFFRVSKQTVVLSFVFYILGVFFLSHQFFVSTVLIGIGSCLFHLGSGNIALVSQKRKASHLWIFASGGVIGLSFWGLAAVYFPTVVVWIVGLLIAIGWYIQGEKAYVIETSEHIEKLEKKLRDFFPFIIVGLGSILIARSAIWTHFQQAFWGNTQVLVSLAICAFFWKILWGFLEDTPKFKERYLWVFWVIALASLAIYSYLLHDLVFLFLWIVGIQLFVSPITYILYTYMKEWKSTIIGFTFWCSLVLGYLLLRV